MNKRFQIIPALFWVGTSIFVMIGSYKLELGSFYDPGPGLMPFLLAMVLLIVSIPVVVQSLAKEKTGQETTENGKIDKIDFPKVISVTGSLFLYALLLERLGYLLSTSLLLMFLFRMAGSNKWKSIFAISILTVFSTYYGFTLLGLRLPRGILKGW